MILGSNLIKNFKLKCKKEKRKINQLGCTQKLQNAC